MGALGIGVFLKTFLNTGNGTDALTRDDVASVFSEIDYRLSIINDVFTTADSAASAAVTAATDASRQAERIGQDVKDTTERIVDTIIPRSQEWLLGYLVSHYFGPILSELTKNWHLLSFLVGWRSQIDVWRHKFVDPHLEQWIGFQEWFNTWPRGVVFTVHDWLDHPARFAQWATPPLIGPIIVYLAQREHMESRDNLSTLMVRAWAERPEQTWQLIEEWLIAGR